MKDPMSDVVVINKIKYLGFVYISGVCEGVQNAIGVDREILPVTFFYFWIRTFSYSFLT